MWRTGRWKNEDIFTRNLILNIRTNNNLKNLSPVDLYAYRLHSTIVCTLRWYRRRYKACEWRSKYLHNPLGIDAAGTCSCFWTSAYKCSTSNPLCRASVYSSSNSSALSAIHENSASNSCACLQSSSRNYRKTNSVHCRKTIPKQVLIKIFKRIFQ